MVRNTVNVREQNKELSRLLSEMRIDRDNLRRLVVRLYDNGIVSGAFGPWSDHWTDEDREMWGKIEDWKEEFNGIR